MAIATNKSDAVLATEERQEWLRLDHKYSGGKPMTTEHSTPQVSAVFNSRDEAFDLTPLSLWPLEPLSIYVVMREVAFALRSCEPGTEMIEHLRHVRRLISCHADRRELDANFALYQPIDDLLRLAIVAMWPGADNGAVWPLLRETVDICKSWIEIRESAAANEPRQGSGID